MCYLSPMLAGYYGLRRDDVAARVRERARQRKGGSETDPDGDPLWLVLDGFDRTNHDGGMMCALDGQLDNLGELAEQLGSPAGDVTAVLAAAWGAWGESMVERLRGPFVAAVWDGSVNRGMIAVDQLGMRSLFHCRHGGGVMFADEVAGLLALLDRRPEPDSVHIAHWLSFTDPPPSGTLYAGIERVPGGSYLRLADARCTLVPYWPGPTATVNASSREEASAELRQRLERAVARTLAAGPQQSGLLLSGGLDSATVASLAAARAGRDRLRAYSATFPEAPSADESSQIGALAGRFGLLPVSLGVVRGSAVRGSIEFLERSQLPASSPNLFFWLPMLRRAAGEGVRIMLDGEGGDELFAAARYLAADRLRRGHPVDAYRLIMALPGAGAGAPLRRVLPVVGEYAIRGALPDPVRRLCAQLGWGRADTPFWLEHRTARLHRATADPDRWMAAPGPRWRAWLLHTIRDSTGGPQLARDHVRQRTQMASLVDRHPLLDVDVVELVLATDPELACDPFLDRPLLREAMRGALPDSVRLRAEKTSFDAPFQQSLTRELAPISRLLCDPQSELRAYVDMAAVRSEVLGRPGTRFALGGQAWALALWRLVTAELWLRLQRDALAPQTALERCGFPVASLENPSVSRS